MRTTKQTRSSKVRQRRGDLLTSEDEWPNPVVELDVRVPAAEYDVRGLNLEST